MTIPSDEPAPELTTERVRSARRAALAAGAVAVVLIGVLVWKPWDTGPVTATLRPTLPVVAVATAPPTPITTPVATPQPTDINNDQQIVAAPDGLGSVAFYPDEGPAGWCIYKAADKKGPLTLSVILVEPPVVIVGDSAGGKLQSIRWHIALETNTQDKLFDSEWIPAFDSEAKTIDADQFGFVKPISVAIPSAASITVFRAPMIIDWLGHDSTVLATQRVLPGVYGVLGAPITGTQPGGCPKGM